MNHSAAERLIDKGYTVVPLRAGSKAACTDYRNRDPPEEILRRVRDERLNIGILLEGLSVLDVDGPEGLDWVRRHGLKSPMVCETSKGLHLYFRGRAVERNRIKFRKDLDVLVNGYTVAPSSVLEANEWRYRWKRGFCEREGLPELPKELFLEEKPMPSVRNIISVTREQAGMILNPRGYVLKVESHQGSGGSRRLCHAILVLRDAGWTIDQTYRFLVEEWNCEPRVTPPWSHQEIARAVERMYLQPVR